MAGEVKRMLDRIIELRSRGNETIARTTKTKLILKGINPSKFTVDSENDPEIIARIKQIAIELGVKI